MTDYLDENLFEKELIILKVIEVKNAVFAIIFFFFNHGFKFQDSVRNGCHDLTMLIVNTSGIGIITIKNVNYCCIIHNTGKSEAIKILFLRIVVI